MVLSAGSGHHRLMATKRVKAADRPPPHPTFLKKWRKYRRFTQEALAALAGTTASTISDLENGKQRYTQALLEALAAALDTHPGLILLRAPDVQAEAWLILDQLSPQERARALDVLRAFAGRQTSQAAE
jgi:transcriptional regulator with XRE-family HTH domain